MGLSSLLELFSASGPVLLPLLLDAALKGLAILLFTAVATLAMRGASAAARHLAWFLGTLGLLVLPIMSAALPAWHILPRWASPPSLSSSQTDALSTISPSVVTQNLASDAPSLTPALIPTPAHSSPLPPHIPAPKTIHLTWHAWLLLAWLAGTVLLLAHIALGLLSLAWLRHRSSRLTKREDEAHRLVQQLCSQLGLRRPVELLSSPSRTMPMTWGLWRTRLLLPVDSANWTAEQRRTVLLHELAHAKRWDCLTQLLTQFACALHWFNPLVWLAARQMQTERERACDDLVLNAGTKPSAYATQLLHIATNMPTVRYSAAAIAMARPSTLETRLHAILDNTRNRRTLTAFGSVCAAIVLLVTLIPLAMAQQRSEIAVPPNPRSTATSPARHLAGDFVATALPNQPPTTTVTLPENNTVELLAIGRYPDPSNRWWLPDGSPSPRQYQTGAPGASPWSAEDGFRIVFHFAKTPPADAHLQFRLSAPSGSRIHFTNVRSQDLEKPYVFFTELPTHPQKVSIRLGQASGPWQTLAQYDPHTHQATGVLPNGYAFQDAVNEDRSFTEIIVAHPSDDRELRLFAIDSDGLEHETDMSWFGRDEKGVEDNFRFEKLPLARINAFRLESRQYHWVEFQNIAFRPIAAAAPSTPPAAATAPALRSGLRPADADNSRLIVRILPATTAKPDQEFIISDATRASAVSLSPPSGKENNRRILIAISGHITGKARITLPSSTTLISDDVALQTTIDRTPGTSTTLDYRPLDTASGALTVRTWYLENPETNPPSTTPSPK